MKLQKPLYIILIVITLMALLEGVVYINLQNNYVNLNSSNKELQDQFNHLQNEYEEIKFALQDLNNSYLRFLDLYFGEYGDVTVEQAKRLVEEKSELVIVDVRTLAEYTESRIEGAINVCVGCKPEEILNYLNSDEEILLYCERGYRSAIAMQILFDNGYSKVYNMQGGIVAWIEAGFPVVEG